MKGDNFILKQYLLTVFIVFKRLRTKVRDTANYKNEKNTKGVCAVSFIVNNLQRKI